MVFAWNQPESYNMSKVEDFILNNLLINHVPGMF